MESQAPTGINAPSSSGSSSESVLDVRPAKALGPDTIRTEYSNTYIMQTAVSYKTKRDYMIRGITSPRILKERCMSSIAPDEKPCLPSHTDDLHREFRPIVRARRDILDFAQREHAVDNFAEHDVLAIQKVTLGGRDKELGGNKISDSIYG